MKWIKRLLIVLVVLVAAVVITAMFFLGSVIKTGVNEAGPGIMGVDVSLGGAKVFPLRGKANLTDLVVGNPKGYKTPSAFELGELDINLDVKSILSDRIVINRILISKPEITFEGSLKGSNISALIDQMSSSEEAAEEPVAEEPEKASAAGGGKKLEIDELVMEGANIRLSSGLLMGKALNIPMPTLTLTGIGKDKGGASIQDVVTEIMGAVSGAVVDAVKSSGALLGKGVESAGKIADQGVGAASDLAGEGAQIAGDAAAQAGELAGQGVDAASEAAGKAVDALGSGADKLKKGLGGLLKKSE